MHELTVTETSVNTTKEPDYPIGAIYLNRRIVSLLARKMEHEGSLYGLPAMPKPEETKSTSDHGRSFFAGIQGKIARGAVGKFLECEAEKAVAKMKAEIEEKGVDAVLSYFKENKL
jgi:hypothetical protein